MLDKEDIAFVIGSGYGGATKNYKYLIYEACEYQDHFLAYKPDILVINNIELDHPDYFNSINDVYNSFIKLGKQAKKVVLNNNILLPKKDNYVYYGNSNCEYNYRIIEENQEGFIIEINGEIFELPFYGKHMIDNFLSA